VDADSTLSPEKVAKKLRDMTVVDVDVHIHETPGQLAPYCEMPWRKALENIAKVPYRYLDAPGFSPVFSAWPAFPHTRGERRSTMSSSVQARADLDDLGIDIGILFPDHLLMHAGLKNDEYAVAVAQAYNRWLVDEWLGEDNGLKGAIIAPHHNPIEAADEIRRYAAHPNVAAVYLPTACVDPLYGHRRYNPVYDAAQETGLPVFLHSVTAVHPVFPFNIHGYETIFSAHVIAHPFSMVANLVSMIETGVPVRFPELKVAFTEGGISWVPWIMLRLDKEYGERRRDVAFLRERPSIYVKRMFFATQPIEEPESMGDLATILSLFDGENCVLFSSDWPHHDFDHPSKLLQIPIGDEGLRKIMGGNALRLFNLPDPRS
jgi:predicted TIM-barrel fold metal-dependent hydrolase